MKCRIWWRAVLSTVGHAPTTILADFAWWGTHAVQPWRPSHGYFGKVEIGSKIWKLPVEIFGPNFVPNVRKTFGGTPA